MALLLDTATLERARWRTRLETFVPAWRRLTEATDAFLSLDIQPPDEPAGYYHDYFCPHHATELQFDPVWPQVHRCPVDGQVLAGRRFDAAWRFGANLLLGSMSVLLALRWRLSGEQRCLQRAAEILTGYARRYPHYAGSQNSESGTGLGWATYQSLDEAHLIIRLAQCHDLVAAELDPGERVMVERQLFDRAIAHIARERFRRIHNIECWHIAALVAAATVTGKDAIRDYAVYGEFGFYHQIDAGTHRDGFWWEGSSSYHYYTLAALLTTAAFIRARHPNWHAPRRLAAMLAAPLTLVLPDGRLPASNDCWASSSLYGKVCHGVPPAAALYEMAAGWWPEPLYVDLLRGIYRDGPRDSEEALLHGPDAVPADASSLPRPRSAVLPHSGFAMVRSDDELDRQSLALLKFGPHGGSHGHPDKLAVTLYARGEPAAADLGTQGYGIGLHGDWYRQTASHNTVLVSGRKQPPAAGTLLYSTAPHVDGVGEPSDHLVSSQVRHDLQPRACVGSDSGTPVTVADAAVRWSGASAGPYDGVAMRRAIAWRDPYFVDCFHVRCPTRRRIDWLLHVHGELRETHGVELHDRAGGVLPRSPGWRHIEGRRAGRSHGAVDVWWSLPSGALQVLLPDEAGTVITVGNAPANPASERLHSVVRTRYARATTFVAVIHPCDDPGDLTATLHSDARQGATLQVKLGGRTDRWRLAVEESGVVPGLSSIP